MSEQVGDPDSTLLAVRQHPLDSSIAKVLHAPVDAHEVYRSSPKVLDNYTMQQYTHGNAAGPRGNRLWIVHIFNPACNLFRCLELASIVPVRGKLLHEFILPLLVPASLLLNSCIRLEFHQDPEPSELALAMWPACWEPLLELF